MGPYIGATFSTTSIALRTQTICGRTHPRIYRVVCSDRTRPTEQQSKSAMARVCIHRWGSCGKRHAREMRNGRAARNCWNAGQQETARQHLTALAASAVFMPMPSETVAMPYTCRHTHCAAIPVAEMARLITNGAKNEFEHNIVEESAVDSRGQGLNHQCIVIISIPPWRPTQDPVRQGAGAHRFLHELDFWC